MRPDTILAPRMNRQRYAGGLRPLPDHTELNAALEALVTSDVSTTCGRAVASTPSGPKTHCAPRPSDLLASSQGQRFAAHVTLADRSRSYSHALRQSPRLSEIHRVRPPPLKRLALHMIVFFTLAGGLGVTHGAIPSRDSNTALGLASEALQRSDFGGAIRILEPAMTSLGSNPSAWRSLGLAHLRLHEPDLARQAYLKALALDPANALPALGLGIASAQLGHSDDAFAWLQKARADRWLDISRIDGEPDLASLRFDPRYDGLRHHPDDFSHPFVEDVNIIREWDGEAAGDQFGWIARVIGDVDDDGVNDFVTSAPTKNIHGESAGRIYVYSGRTGSLLWSVDGSPGDELGSGIESAGDANGDGVPDVIGSAPPIDAVYVYSGHDGHVLLSLHGEAKGDRFGEHVSAAGDFVGDGHADVLVGAPGNSAGGRGAGRAYLYAGNDGRLLMTLTGAREGDAFGSTVAGYSDGKHRFLVVGAPAAGPRRNGRVYVYRDLSTHPAFVIDADLTG